MLLWMKAYSETSQWESLHLSAAKGQRGLDLESIPGMDSKSICHQYATYSDYQSPEGHLVDKVWQSLKQNTLEEKNPRSNFP